MTFEECKEKYPIGCINGIFLIAKQPSRKEIILRELSNTKLLYHFYIYKNHNYYRVDLYYKKCEGYVTKDGIDFRPYTCGEDDYFNYFDAYPPVNDNESFFLLAEPALEGFISIWNSKNNIKAISCLKDFYENEKYNF